MCEVDFCDQQWLGAFYACATFQIVAVAGVDHTELVVACDQWHVEATDSLAITVQHCLAVFNPFAAVVAHLE